MLRMGFIAGCVLAIACGDDENNGDNGKGCNSCSDNELCVLEFSDPDQTERCEPIPEVCGETGDCMNFDCQAAMYDYCPDETSAWGCSDTNHPTYISCTL